MRECRKCGKPVGKYKRLCHECKPDSQVVKKSTAKARFKFKITHENNQDMEQPKKELKKPPLASQRWAKMSWCDLMAECERYGIKYKDSQLMAQKGTLPEDFGKGVRCGR